MPMIFKLPEWTFNFKTGEVTILMQLFWFKILNIW